MRYDIDKREDKEKTWGQGGGEKREEGERERDSGVLPICIQKRYVEEFLEGEQRQTRCKRQENKGRKQKKG